MHPQTGEIFDKEEIQATIQRLEKELAEAKVDLPPNLNPEIKKKIKELKAKLKEAEQLIDIPPKDFLRVVNMNRKQRRAWAAQQRKKTKR